MGVLLFVLTVVSFAILFISVTFGIDYYDERKKYNDGDCPVCGKPLMIEDYDEYNNRYYRCVLCDYDTWVHYPSVDGRRF